MICSNYISHGPWNIDQRTSTFRASSKDIEMLLMKQRIGLHNNVFLRPVLDVVQRNEFATLQGLRDLRIHAHRDLFAITEVRHLLDLLLNVVADRFRRFRPARPVAMRTRPAQRTFERWLRPLARNGDKTEIIEL